MAQANKSVYFNDWQWTLMAIGAFTVIANYAVVIHFMTTAAPTVWACF